MHIKSTLVFYHRNCPSGDGFAAALAAWLKFGSAAEYVPMDYDDIPPDVSGKDVFILDLSFSPEVMQTLSEQANSLNLLDHHVTAMRKLSAFKPVCCGKVHFDLGKCGATLAWEHFHPDKPLPAIFRYIQDRDLWTWKEPFAKEILAWLDSWPKEFGVWAEIAQMDYDTLAHFAPVGKALNDQFDRLCASIASKPAPIHIDGFSGLMVNASGEFRSEVGSLLALKSGTFGVVWRLAEDGTVLVSLRSTQETAAFDVEALAVRFGGGGHKTAASFRLTADKLPALAAGVIERPWPAKP